MKLKRFLAVLIVAAIALSLVPGTVLAAREPSDWAKPEMAAANVNGLLTPSAAKDFARKMTREEFCEIVVLFVEKTLGRELPLTATSPFTDTNSEFVQKAYLYGRNRFGTGIVNGTTDTLFSPNELVQRQQIAAMLIRAYKQMEVDLNRTLLQAPAATLNFKDTARINDYAIEPIKYAVSNGMFQGDNLNNFNPLNDIKSEESVAVIIRSFTQTQRTLNTSLADSTLIAKAYDEVNIGFAYGDTATGVSQDLTLPASTLSGATVTWTSTNPAVIDNYGRVLVRQNATVVLTATITLGSYTRTKTFTLYTTSLSGDELLRRNAKDALNVKFRNADDTLTRVTGDVLLPTSILGLPVTWTSSNPSFLTNGGKAYLPNDASERTVTLTASFGSGTTYDTKSFTLTLRNPNFSDEVYLHNIKLGMTLAQATSALGSQPKRTITLASGETWSIYYTVNTSSTASDYNIMKNFVAVAVQNNRIVGVYSMASSWANALRDGTGASSSKVLTITEVNRISGIAIETFNDSRSSTPYAAFLYDTTATVGRSRTLNVAGLEDLLAELLNAYRSIYNVKPLTVDSKLASSARTHSANLTYYNIFNDTGSTNGSTYQTRANTAGFTGTVTYGFISNNQINPFNYLDNIVSTTAYRNALLSSSATVIGTGASTGTTGLYSDIVTAVIGVTNTIRITGVTATPSPISVDVNRSTQITLTLAPTNYDEGFTVTTGNQNIFTVTATSNPRVFTIYGVASGTANLVFKSDSGLTVNIPVTVGTVYATSITVANVKYLMETGRTQQIAAPSILPTNATVKPTYTSSVPNVASVNANGVISSAAIGDTQISVRIARSTNASQDLIAAGKIDVKVGSLTVPTTVQNLTVGTNATPSVSASSGLTLAYSSNNTAVATVNASTGQVTPVSAGTAVITVRATVNGYTGTISKTYTVNVTASTVDYPTSATASKSTVTVDKDSSETISINLMPSNVILANRVVTLDSAVSGVTVSISGTNVTIRGDIVGTYNIQLNVKAGAGGAIIPVDVTVKVNPTTPVVSISGNLTMAHNGSQTLNAQNVPAGAAHSWSILEGNTYATIDTTNGTITAQNTTETTQQITVVLNVGATSETNPATAYFTITIGPALTPDPGDNP